MDSDTISLMKELGLLSWRTLLVGWLRGWVKRHDVIEYASYQLVNGVQDPTSEIAQLAGAESYSDEEIRSRLVKLTASREEPLDKTVVDNLKEWQSYSEVDPTVRRDLDKWRLAALVNLARRKISRPDLLDRLEETWTEFGYPQDMEQVSRYYFSPEERASGYQVTEEVADRPFTQMLETIDNLSREVGGAEG